MDQLIIWGALFVFFVVFESITTQLVTIWFAAGALGAFFVALATDSLALQIVVFLVISVVLLIFTRPFMKKFLEPRYTKTNAADTLVGKPCVVTEEINNLQNTGRIAEHGLGWNARSQDDQVVIPVGTTVSVVRLEGVTAYVTIL